MDFQEDLNKLKIHHKAFTNKELAQKMGLSESTLKLWSKNKKIPKKYLNVLKSADTKIEKNNNNITNGNIIQGHINIINNNGYSHKVCEEIQKLPEKRQEYYYYKIKAEVLELED